MKGRLVMIMRRAFDIEAELSMRFAAAISQPVMLRVALSECTTLPAIRASTNYAYVARGFRAWLCDASATSHYEQAQKTYEKHRTGGTPSRD